MPAPHLTAAELENVIAFLEDPRRRPPSRMEAQRRSQCIFRATAERLAEPQNWLTYWGDYRGTHYSRLNSITPANVRTLAPVVVSIRRRGGGDRAARRGRPDVRDRSPKQRRGSRCPHRPADLAIYAARYPTSPRIAPS